MRFCFGFLGFFFFVIDFFLNLPITFLYVPRLPIQSFIKIGPSVLEWGNTQGFMLDLPLALGRVQLHQKKFLQAEEAFLTTLKLSKEVQSTWASNEQYEKYALEGLITVYRSLGNTEKEHETPNTKEYFSQLTEKTHSFRL